MRNVAINCIGYLSPRNYEANLRQELLVRGMKILKEHGRLFFVEKSSHPLPIYWQQNIWQDVYEMPTVSIKQCASQLRRIQKHWCFYSHTNHLRCKLIQDHLPSISTDPVTFPIDSSSCLSQLGSFTLIDRDTMLYSGSCSQKFPNGELIFNEDKIGPPNRAYLKLWEVFTLVRKHPQIGDRVIELGAAPGGWTWVLQQLKTDIFSCDRSPLDPKLLEYKYLKQVQQDAFQVLPETQEPGTIHWLFSDLICYPEKLLPFIIHWIQSGRVNNIVCTLKLQGHSNTAIIDQFANIPNSTILHLPSNKNELTFFWSKMTLSIDQ